MAYYDQQVKKTMAQILYQHAILQLSVHAHFVDLNLKLSDLFFMQKFE